MSTQTSAIIDVQPEAPGKPSVTYRYAGDRALLLEYGEMVFDLTLNFFAQAADDALRHDSIEGLVETAPGFRSILVSYDPASISLRSLLVQLKDVHEQLQPGREMVVPSRLIHLPVAFDDSQTRHAVERYRNSIRKDAPNCEGGTNVEYILRYNGLSNREELYETVLATEQWSAFIGFFPGLPFMFPLDPRDAVTVPKYNPTRTWTPEGALGIGGPCFAIYPVESAGGYQLFGRTIPIYDLAQRNAAFRESPMLLRASDRLKFHRVEEDELLRLFEDVHGDRYRYRIEEGELDVGAWLAWTAEIREEAEERRRRREAAAATTPVP